MGRAEDPASDDALGGIAGAHVDIVLAAETLEGLVGAGAGVGGFARAAGVGRGGFARAGGREGGQGGCEEGGEEHFDDLVFVFQVFVVIQGKKRTSLGSLLGRRKS